MRGNLPRPLRKGTFLLVLACVNETEIRRRAKEAEDVEVELYQVAETLPDHVIEAMGAKAAKEALKAVPVINQDRHQMMEILKSADAIILGSGTRFGSVPAQMKTFMDSLGQLWVSDALVGKVTHSDLHF